MPKIPTIYTSLEEIPENERSFYIEEEGKIFYLNDGLLKTIENQRKSENQAKEELERLKKELAQKQDQKQETQEPKKEMKEDPKDKELEELKKQVSIMQEGLKQAEFQKQEMNKKNLQLEAVKNSGIDPQLYSIFDNSIGYDEKGIFVKDEEGKPALDPMTGARVQVTDFYKQKIKENPKFAMAQASGSNFQSLNNGIQGQQYTASKIKSLKSEYFEAVKKGDMYTIDRIEKEAIKNGFKL